MSSLEIVDRYKCLVCGEEYIAEIQRWRCDCSSPLSLLEVSPRVLECVDLYAMTKEKTPLVKWNLKEDLYFKCEYLRPTGSFKDRGSVFQSALAKVLGAKLIISDTSGNSGAGIAAYSARMGIDCRIYVPSTNSSRKIEQMRAYGAEVVEVEGTRDDVKKMVEKLAESDEYFYASHAWNPHFIYGMRPIAFELIEQLEDGIDCIIVPTGSGSLLLGLFAGLEELLSSKRIAKIPAIVAVQSSAFNQLSEFYDAEIETRFTLAEGISVLNTPRIRECKEAVERTGGFVVDVSDVELLESLIELQKTGFYVEPTSAVVYAAYKKHLGRFTGNTVAILTGSGFKSNPTNRKEELQHEIHNDR